MPPSSPFDVAAKIYDDEFAEPADRLEVYADFIAIVKQLRRDCPWDREQTHESVKHLLIEEAYEVVEAIESGDPEELKKELGDVFLHVLFHARIAEEADRFTIRDVMEAEMDKLIRRHPHVFGDASTDDTDEVLANWEKIKQQERADDGEETPSVLDGVPTQLPALLRALRVQEKAAGVGFDFPDRAQAWDKVEEELREFTETLERDAPEADKEAEFGDLLFGLVNYARYEGINPENALRRTNDTFTSRFQHIEDRLAEDGKTVADVDLPEADALWEEAKSLERRGGERVEKEDGEKG
jgi:XTP/dITP diphosphohydrolase/tetrapyrrole methylase family protein/MazG family protein